MKRKTKYNIGFWLLSLGCVLPFVIIIFIFPQVFNLPVVIAIMIVTQFLVLNGVRIMTDNFDMKDEICDEELDNETLTKGFNEYNLIIEEKNCSNCKYSTKEGLCYTYYEDGLSMQIDDSFICWKWD